MLFTSINDMTQKRKRFFGPCPDVKRARRQKTARRTHSGPFPGSQFLFRWAISASRASVAAQTPICQPRVGRPWIRITRIRMGRTMEK